MQVVFYFLIFILGACLGSFLCCQARRLHFKESSQAKNKLKPKKSLGSRSVCMHCHHRLKWYDNIPIISWLILRGKCRECHKKIGAPEILSELGLGLAFLALGSTLDISSAGLLEWATFIVMLLLTITLGFLAIYDGAYGELPTLPLFISIILATTILALEICATLSTSTFAPSVIINPILSIAILSGLYLVLYLISKGKWVGDGDWLLGLSMGLVLASPWLALITLFLSNLLACLIMYPATKGKKQRKIHFGPFMVAAFIITYSFSSFLLNLI